MSIKRERPSQRMHHRVDAPLQVVLNGETCRTVNWSLGGCRLPLVPDGLATGDRQTLTLVVPFQGFDIRFDVEAEVVRVFEAEIALRFVALDDRQTALLEHFIEDLLRGSMTAAEDTIRRIDTPVTPISTKPDPNPLSETPVRRLPLGRLLKTGFYLMLGAGVFGYAGLMLYLNIMTLEVRSAVVAAPIETVLASTSGVITDLAVAPDVPVAAGTMLMAIEDANLEEAIERARIKIDAARLDRRAEADSLARAEARLMLHRQTAESDLRAAKVALVEQQALVATSQAAVTRWRRLLKKGHATRSSLDVAEAAAARDRAGLAVAEQRVADAGAVLQGMAGGRVFDGRLFRDEIVEIKGRIDHADQRIRLAERELVALQGQRGRLAVRAPADGRLVRLFKSLGSGVKRSEPIALFETVAGRTIEAYLTQAEAGSIRIGSTVPVRFPGLDQTGEAVVLGVDRTDSYIDPVHGRYTWRDPEARTARVLLRPASAADQTLAAGTPPGTPVIVLFDRDNLANRLLDRLFDRSSATTVGSTLAARPAPTQALATRSLPSRSLPSRSLPSRSLATRPLSEESVQ